MSNDFQTHLLKLKSFNADDAYDGINKLYFLELEEKPSMVKVFYYVQDTGE